MKKYYLLSFFLLMAFLADAQQISMYNHYYYKPMIYNPAFTGSDEATNVFLISRSQWAGFKNSPQLNIATIDGNLTDKMGLGFGLITDRKGLSRRIGGNVNYSYRLNITEDAHLRFGISIGVIDQTIDYSKAVVENQTDPGLFNGDQRKTVLDGNAGLAFIWKNLEFGAAVPQILGNKINYIENNDVRSSYTQARHYIGSLKYKIFILKDKGLSVTPLVLVRFLPNAPIQYDANLNFNCNDKFWLGATYKNDYGISANVGFRIHKQLNIGYSYDIITGSIGKYSGVSHEIMLNFKFGKKETAPLPPAQDFKEDIAAIENKFKDRLDSLENKEKINQEKIKELSEKLEQQKLEQQKLQQQQNQQRQTNTNNNHDTAVVENNTNKLIESGIPILTNKAKNFKDVRIQEAKQGFYVIVGTFYYRDLAEAETKRFRDKGYNADYIFNEGFNYIYTHKMSSKTEALQIAQMLKSSGITDVWVQELIK